MKKIFIFLLVIIAIGCTDKKERHIYKACKEIISKTRANEIDNFTPYLMVTEDTLCHDSIIYKVTFEICQNGETNIFFTDYKIIDDIYVLLLQKNKEKHLITPIMKEELYNWGGGINFETSFYFLKLSQSTFKYTITEVPWWEWDLWK